MSLRTTVRPAGDRVARAFERVIDEPLRALSEAQAILADATLAPEERCRARWICGLARIELDQHERASADLLAARREATRLSLPELTGHIRMSLSNSLFAAGQTTAALRELTLARRELSEAGAGRVEMQRGLVLLQAGRLGEAEKALDAAIALLRAGGEGAYEAKALANRGALLTMTGKWRRAEADLVRLGELATHLQLRLLQAGAFHNLGFLASRQGDIPTALTRFGQAREAYARAGEPGRLVAALNADEAEVLLQAGLSAEAWNAAERLVAYQGAVGNQAGYAEAVLLAARCAHADERFEQAASLARQAATLFEGADRVSWACLARFHAIGASVARAADGDPGVDPDELELLARHLAQHGWRTAALQARTLIARCRLGAGDVAAAQALLDQVSAMRSSGPTAARVEVWHLTALTRIAAGNIAGGRRALAAGMRVIDSQRARVGARELRAEMAAAAAGLAREGLRVALGQDRPADVLRWSEWCRAATSTVRAVRPPPDPLLRDALADLRRLEGRLTEAISSGVGSIDAARDAVTGAERRITERVRQLAGPGHEGRSDLDLASLRARLGGRTMAVFLAHEGALLRITVTARSLRLERLAPVREVSTEIDYLSAASRRVTFRARSASSVTAARAVIARAAGALDRVLLEGLDTGDGPLVVVPTGDLHGLPWAWLPTLGARPFTVAPSASSWLQSAALVSAAAPSAPALVACGPDIAAGETESSQVAASYPDVVRLSGGDATVERTLCELARVGTAHIAAHGTFRARAPMFSSLRMSDGSLTVHDLEMLRSVPSLVVLPVCDSGRSAVRPGDELVGTAAALLSLGVRSIVAPVAPVASEETAMLMVGLHRHLGGGSSPADGLHAVLGEVPADDAVALASSRSFLCFGS